MIQDCIIKGNDSENIMVDGLSRFNLTHLDIYPRSRYAANAADYLFFRVRGGGRAGVLYCAETARLRVH